jgi:hypothetical protein
MEVASVARGNGKDRRIRRVGTGVVERTFDRKKLRKKTAGEVVRKIPEKPWKTPERDSWRGGPENSGKVVENSGKRQLERLFQKNSKKVWQ